jgi:hypothetical protein
MLYDFLDYDSFPYHIENLAFMIRNPYYPIVNFKRNFKRIKKTRDFLKRYPYVTSFF